MTDYMTTSTELTGVANAIRTKGGTSGQLTYPNGFVSAINAIPTGGTEYLVSSDNSMWSIVTFSDGTLILDTHVTYQAGSIVALVNPEGNSIYIEDGNGLEIQAYSIGCNSDARSTADIEPFEEIFGQGEGIYIAFFEMPESDVYIYG